MEDGGWRRRCCSTANLHILSQERAEECRESDRAGDESIASANKDMFINERTYVNGFCSWYRYWLDN